MDPNISVQKQLAEEAAKRQQSQQPQQLKVGQTANRRKVNNPDQQPKGNSGVKGLAAQFEQDTKPLGNKPLDRRQGGSPQPRNKPVPPQGNEGSQNRPTAVGKKPARLLPELPANAGKNQALKTERPLPVLPNNNKQLEMKKEKKILLDLMNLYEKLSQNIPVPEEISRDANDLKRVLTVKEGYHYYDSAPQHIQEACSDGFKETFQSFLFNLREMNPFLTLDESNSQDKFEHIYEDTWNSVLEEWDQKMRKVCKPLVDIFDKKIPIDERVEQSREFIDDCSELDDMINTMLVPLAQESKEVIKRKKTVYDRKSYLPTNIQQVEATRAKLLKLKDVVGSLDFEDWFLKKDKDAVSKECWHSIALPMCNHFKNIKDSQDGNEFLELFSGMIGITSEEFKGIIRDNKDKLSPAEKNNFEQCLERLGSVFEGDFEDGWMDMFIGMLDIALTLNEVMQRIKGKAGNNNRPMPTPTKPAAATKPKPSVSQRAQQPKPTIPAQKKSAAPSGTGKLDPNRFNKFGGK